MSSLTNAAKSRGLGGEGNKDGLDIGLKGQSVLECNQLPPEITTLFEDFKRFVKQQKMIKEENSEQRFNVEPILTVDESIKHILHSIDVDLQSNAKQVEALKKETTKLLSYGEVAYRLVKAEITSSSSCVNKYFLSLVEEFESKMNTYSSQIKILENHMKNMNKPYSCDELFGILKKQHETLIALAENVYLIHEQVNNLKQKGDKDSNQEVFSAIDGSRKKTATLLGPNPFAKSSETITAMETVSSVTAQPTFGLFSTVNQPNSNVPPLQTSFTFSNSGTSFSQPSKNKRWTPS